MYSKKGIPLVKIAQSKTTYKRNIPMNYFTTSLMKNLFTNDNNLPLFEQAVTELLRSELEKSIHEILDEFREVYQSKNKEEAEKKLIDFKEKWKRKYPQVIKSLENNSHLFTYYEYPKEVRASIYTTNLIEGVNKQIKRKFKAKNSFQQSSQWKNIWYHSLSNTMKNS